MASPQISGMLNVPQVRPIRKRVHCRHHARVVMRHRRCPDAPEEFDDEVMTVSDGIARARMRERANQSARTTTSSDTSACGSRATMDLKLSAPVAVAMVRR